MTIRAASSHQLASRLRSRLDGRVVGPQDPGWDEARRAWNLAVDQHPAVVARPGSADDVVAVVEVAHSYGLRVAAQGSGHGAAPRGSLEGSVLVDMSGMNAVEIDPHNRLARIQAGAQWQDVVGPAAKHGLAGLSGSAGDVCVTGYALGGGAGWMVRRYGLAAGSIRAVDVVTADGRLLRASADSEPDLLWALRGGGGSFGVVTALELDLFAVPELYAGVLFWPQERAAEVLEAWREWTTDLPEEMTSLGRLVNVPLLEEIPEPLRGRSFAVVEAAWIGDEAGGSEQLAPLRELGPEIDTFAPIAPPGLAELHMDPPEPVPSAGDGMLLADFPSEAIAAVVEAAGPGTNSPLVSLEIRHLGGAVDTAAPEDGAFAAVDAPYLLFAVGTVMAPQAKQAVELRLDRVRSALAPWDGGRLLTFAERPDATGGLFPDHVERRLRELKTAYDPEDVIQANHEIRPAA
ncbi:MAG: FAD-binding oxidoreductase [Thermoleophilaceae bacterium]|nr:FAD-binding oxidoreductase [Thermoleophilaceae bacterium]